MVIQTLTDTYRAVPTIYFYCYFGEKDRQTLLDITKSLLKQLSARCEGLDSKLVSAFSNDTSLTTESSETLFSAALSRFEKVFIVVDALDECNHEERRSIVELFNRQMELSGCCIKIFLTSRPEIDLRHLLQSNLNHYINADDTSKDITPYVTATVERHIAGGRLLGGTVTPMLKTHIIETINSKADGM